MPGIVFPPAWVLPECECLLDLVARQVLFVDLHDVFDFAWVREDEFSTARPLGVDRALAAMTLIERGFLGFGDGALLRKENGQRAYAGMLIFRPTGRQLYEYIDSGR